MAAPQKTFLEGQQCVLGLSTWILNIIGLKEMNVSSMCSRKAPGNLIEAYKLRTKGHS